MLRIRVLTSCLLAGGIMIVAASSASAQTFENAGVIRISDSPIKSDSPVPIAEGTSLSGAVDCPPGGMPAYGYGHCRRAGGYRFSPPVKRPIYRSPVSYTKGFSDAWTGQSVASQRPAYRAPTVYMPTDTTQLGYYYQTVPYWQPKPGAIPPPPIPAQWHTTVGQLPTYGHYPAGFIYGTAPTAVPNSPTPPPWGPQGLPPEPTPASTSIPPVEAPIQVNSLEPASSSPTLLPIN